MLSLLELLLLEVASKDRVAVLINAVREVLASHTDDSPFPYQEFPVINEIPLLHQSQASEDTVIVQKYWCL